MNGFDVATNVSVEYEPEDAMLMALIQSYVKGDDDGKVSINTSLLTFGEKKFKMDPAN